MSTVGLVGTGAMGSVYAGLLASAGNEVWTVDPWEEHVDAIRERGLRVEGASGDRTVPNRRGQGDGSGEGFQRPGEVGPESAGASPG